MTVATLTEAYAEAGFVRRNVQWSWSARREDPPGVALTVWEEQVDRRTEPWQVDPTAFRDVALWKDRLGNRERIENIRYGLDRCAGLFHVILIRAFDPVQEPRRVVSRRYLRERVGVIRPEAFDPGTGVFRMALVAMGPPG